MSPAPPPVPESAAIAESEVIPGLDAAVNVDEPQIEVEEADGKKKKKRKAAAKKPKEPKVKPEPEVLPPGCRTFKVCICSFWLGWQAVP